MCDTCGCGDSNLVPVDVHEKLLAGNDRVAAHNREHFADRGVLALNLMGSPGSGKTALLEATARAAAGRWRIAALSGDLATDRDGERLRAAGIPALSITTGSACHLDAEMVHAALHELAWQDRELLFIENVGNLVCPAVYDLGQSANVVALSLPEGDDKPLKYPAMFAKADLVVVTKVDLLPHLPGASLARLAENLARVMPAPRWIAFSSLSLEGMSSWLDWLAERRHALSPASGPTPHHHHHPAPDPHLAPKVAARPTVSIAGGETRR
jgi:hydrogenase nickel incorporation protein HypB